MQVSKRVFVTLPDAVFEDLERWANLEGRPTANLAAFLVETAVKEAKEQGKIPPSFEPPKESSPKGRGK